MKYLFEVESAGFFIIPDGIILLVVESDASLVLGDTVVGECFEQVDSLIDHNVMLKIRILLILDFKVVGRELSDWKIGGADGTGVGNDVGSFSHSSGQDVVNVGFVCFTHDGYDNY